MTAWGSADGCGWAWRSTTARAPFPGEVLQFSVPGPPVPQARARAGPHGHYTPTKSRGYAQMVARCADVAVAGARWTKGGLGPFRIQLDVYRAKAVGDGDNYLKAIKDSLSRVGVWKDDRYVHDSRVRLFIDRANPRAEVRVERLA